MTLPKHNLVAESNSWEYLHGISASLHPSRYTGTWCAD